MSKLDYKRVKVSTLVSVIVHGANRLGVELAKSLTTQGSRVIVIDHFSKEKKTYVNELKKLDRADFVDFSGLEELLETLNRFDYIFYLQNNAFSDGKEFRSKDFLEESNYLDYTLKYALQHKAKVSIVTSLKLNKEYSERQLTESSDKPSPYSPMEIQKYTETLAAEYYDKSKLPVRILRLGTVVSKEYISEEDSDLLELLRDSVSKEEITIKGEGLDTHYLITLEDTIYGILKMTFTDDTNGEVVSLSMGSGFTTLSIAYKLLELNIEASNIKFTESEENKYLLQGKYIPAPNAEEFGWKPKDNLEKALVAALERVYKSQKKSWKEKPSPAELKKINEKAEESEAKTVDVVKTPLGEFIDKILSPFRAVKRAGKSSANSIPKAISLKNIFLFSVVLIGLLLLSYFLITPVAAIGIGGYSMYRESQEAYKHIQSFNLSEAEENLASIKSTYSKVQTGVDRLEWIFVITRQEELYANFSQLAFATGYAIDGANDMVVALEPLAEYIQQFEPAVTFDTNLPTTTREYRDQLTNLQQNRGKLETASYNLLLASDLIESLDVGAFPSGLQEYVLEIKTNNAAISEMLEPFQKVALFLPELLGVEERQRYLVLLQNPSELRSTGGWLSSYAIIGVEGGQIRQLDVDDIYNADGILTVQGKEFDAPEEMTEALGVEEWAFSLVNWDPDFNEVATSSEFFVKESGKAHDLDGVIAVDLTFIQNLLEAWGGVSVPGESEPVTAENLYPKIFQIHSDFTPGSRRKTTFLANLANEVFKNMLSLDAGRFQQLATQLYNGLEQKHILINLKNEDAFAFIDSEGWSGRLKTKYHSAPIPVEWNWGANKANLFLTRNYNLNIEVVNENTIRYNYSVAIENSSDTAVYPEGDYENWMRIYLPENADIGSTTGFLNNQYDTYLSNNSKVIAGWFNTDIKSTSRLDLSYTVINREGTTNFPISVNGNTITFDLTLFKQPGTDDDEYKLNIAYPDSWAVINDEDMNKAINQLSTQFQLDTEKEFQIVWQYK